MVDSSQNIDRFEAIRRETITLLDRLTDQAKGHDLPDPPQGLADSRRKLIDDAYTILVAGEAKRGKSTLVNALIGRRVLPVDVNIATSQVFRIQRAEVEAYRVRFEDDSTREIAVEELDRYGSQIQADEGKMPRLDQLVRWIEVDTPTRFLPPNVTLLDSPGLGSLYAAHAQVTQRFVPYADAVIFVLDSGQPITDLELGFVETVLEATPNILFVQTKIDQQRRSHWETIQERNQAILAERFRGRLLDTRVWPVGSRLLLQGAGADDEDFVIRSRQRELSAALETFLFKVAGWSRSASALTAASHYHASSVVTLQARQNAFAEQSDSERAELQNAAEDRMRQFDADWGEGSERRRDLLVNLRNARVAGRQRFAHAIQRDGEIARSQAARIEALARIEDVRWMGEVLGGDTVKAVIESWQQTGETVRQRFLELLEPFAQHSEAMSWILSVEPPELDTFRGPRDLSPEWVESLPRSPKGEGLAMPLAKGAIDVLMVVGLIVPQVGVAAAAVSLAWTAARRIMISDKAQIQAAKQELRGHLDATLEQIERYFFTHPIPDFGGRTLVDGYFTVMEQTIAGQIQAVAGRRSADAQAEILRLAADTKLDSQRRGEEAALTERQLADWERLGGALKALMADLTTLEQSVSTAPATVTERA